jgi:RNA polymerase sigma-70 factor (ECF subfamily)
MEVQDGGPSDAVACAPPREDTDVSTGIEVARADQDAARDAHEAVLMARVAAGDDGGEALRALHGRYAGPVVALGMRLLGDHGLAEELVQETMLRLWRSAGGFDPARGGARSYVFTIARRAAVDLHRRRAARPVDLLTDVGVTDAGPELGAVEDTGDGLLERLDLRDAVARLSPAHREVIDLGYRLDLTQAEIARRLDLPLGTVKTRSHSALQALRRRLDGLSAAA